MKNNVTVVHDSDWTYYALYVGDKRVYDGECPGIDEALKAVGLSVSSLEAESNGDGDDPNYYPKSLDELVQLLNDEKRRRTRIAQLEKKLATAEAELAKLKAE